MRHASLTDPAWRDDAPRRDGQLGRRRIHGQLIGETANRGTGRCPERLELHLHLGNALEHPIAASTSRSLVSTRWSSVHQPLRRSESTTSATGRRTTTGTIGSQARRIRSTARQRLGCLAAGGAPAVRAATRWSSTQCWRHEATSARCMRSPLGLGERLPAERPRRTFSHVLHLVIGSRSTHPGVGPRSAPRQRSTPATADVPPPNGPRTTMMGSTTVRGSPSGAGGRGRPPVAPLPVGAASPWRRRR